MLFKSRSPHILREEVGGIIPWPNLEIMLGYMLPQHLQGSELELVNKLKLEKAGIQ